MGKKRLKKTQNNSFFEEDEKGIGAGGVPIIPKRKKAKKIG